MQINVLGCCVTQFYEVVFIRINWEKFLRAVSTNIIRMNNLSFLLIVTL